MNIREAIRIVAKAVRESFPSMTDADAVAFLRETINVDELDNDGATFEAYRTIIDADPRELS